MFVCQRINPGQAKTGCRLKTEVALHGFAKIAHYYKRSLAHTSMTPNMITRCEKQLTSPSAWGLAKKIDSNEERAIKITFPDCAIHHIMFGYLKRNNNRFDLIERTSLTLVHDPLIKDQVEP